MFRLIVPALLLVTAPLAAQHSASDLTAQQIGKGAGNTLGVATDPLRVDQPPASAQDTCSQYLNGCEADASVLLDSQTTPSASVEVREDGVYLKLDPASEETYDPDKIAQRLESEETPATSDWGVGGVAQQFVQDAAIETAPIVEEGYIDPTLLTLPTDPQ